MDGFRVCGRVGQVEYDLALSPFCRVAVLWFTYTQKGVCLLPPSLSASGILGSTARLFTKEIPPPYFSPCGGGGLCPLFYC